ncbi:MAG: hypothetical protein ACRD1V_14400, partial [Vicinamibacterales bacterium]
MEPTGTISGLGEYALVVNVDAPRTIDTVIPDDAIGDGTGVGELLLHAVAQPATTATTSAILRSMNPPRER